MTMPSPVETVLTAIEEDHEQLTVLVRRVEQLMKGPVSLQTELYRTLGRLVDETTRHFDRENALMDRLGLEEFAMHRKDHDYLLRCLTDFTKVVTSGTLTPSNEILLDLSRWLGFHIEHFDARLITYLGQIA